MYGGLYGDLPAPLKGPSLPPKAEGSKKDEASPAVSSSPWSITKMAPPSLRKASLINSTPKVPSALKPKPSTTIINPSPVASVPDVHSRYDNQPSVVKAESIEFKAPAAPAAAPILAQSMTSAAASITDEYDPARPNEYEVICRERKRAEKEKQTRKEMEKKRREDEERRKELERHREETLRSSLSVSGEDAWKRRGMAAGGSSANREQTSQTDQMTDEDINNDNNGSSRRSPSPPKNAPMSAAERMMAKMGWKAGQGLGKMEQGITTPLMAKKTDKRAGVIVNAKPLNEPAPSPAPLPAVPANAGAAPGGNKGRDASSLAASATKVLLLRNMVGPGEVDEELENEVKEECGKYGAVNRVTIFEITEKGFPANEAVRIFIEFETEESAIKGLIDLDGRYFGGRAVKAIFFDPVRFASHQLAPTSDEPPAAP